VVEASEALANASLYPADAPALHARFLRRLTSPYLPPTDTPEKGAESEQPGVPDARKPNTQGAQPSHQQLNYAALPPNYNHLAAMANGFQLPQDGLPPNVALAETIWGGQDDGLWTQFDGAWWDRES
jgi:hypothetical protein